MRSLPDVFHVEWEKIQRVRNEKRLEDYKDVLRHLRPKFRNTIELKAS